MQGYMQRIRVQGSRHAMDSKLRISRIESPLFHGIFHFHDLFAVE